MEYLRKRLTTLHVFMLSTMALAAVISAFYFSHAGGSLYDASQVLGQYDPPVTTHPISYTKNDPWNGDVAVSNSGFSGNGSIALDPFNGRTFVLDTASNRVLVYSMDGDATLIDRLPDYVIGQPDFTSSSVGNGAAGLNAPRGIAVNTVANMLLVADTGNNRVVMYDLNTITNGMDATIVLGQDDLFSYDPDVGDNRFNQPQGVDVSPGAGLIFVADTGNSRVLVFDSGAIGGDSAYYVLGQPDFTTVTPGVAIDTFSSPASVEILNGIIFISDTGNNRVLMYVSGLTQNGQDADYVLGQPDFTTNSAGTTAAKLNAPHGVELLENSGRLFVADTGNNRVLVYDTGTFPPPPSSGMAAFDAIGQVDLTSSSAAVTQPGLSQPMDIFGFENQMNSGQTIFSNPPGSDAYYTLYVSDYGNNRLLTYKYLLPGNPTPKVATDVIGQSTTSTTPMGTTPIFTANAALSGDSDYGPLTFRGVQKNIVDTKYHRLFVADGNDVNRILVFDLDANNDLVDLVPDNVIGQPNFTNRSVNFVTQSHIGAMSAMAYDAVDDRLFVGDRDRILVFDVRPVGSTQKTMCGVASNGLANEMNASCVLGQHDFTSNTTDFSLSSEARLDQVTALAYDTQHGHLYANDSGGAVLKVFDISSGISNGMSSAMHTSNYFTAIVDIEYDSVHDRIFVANVRNQDEYSTYGSLVWVYDAATFLTDQAPVNVLGTTHYDGTNVNDLTTLDADQCTTYNGNASWTTTWTAGGICDFVTSIAYDSTNDLLYVAARTFNYNRRVQIFDVASITNGENAIGVLGQEDFTAADNSGPTQNSFSDMNVSGMSVDGGSNKLYMSQGNRLLVFNFIRPVDQALPTGTKDAAYPNTAFATEHEQGTPTLVVVSGLPPGMAFDGTTLSGTPTSSGTFPLVLKAADSFGVSTFSGLRTYVLSIAGGGGGGPIPECQDSHANNFGQQNSCEYDPPQLAITNPVASGTYTLSINTVTVDGTASDNDIVTSLTYSLNGATAVPLSNVASWTTPALTLLPGPNTFTVTATNNHGLSTSKSLVLVYSATPVVETCATNPSLPGCVTTVTPPTPTCATDPTLPGCVTTVIPPTPTPTCATDSSLPGCETTVTPPPPTSTATCVTDPTMPGCIVVPTSEAAGERISTFAMVMSRVGVILGLLGSVFAGGIALSELAFLPQRLWQLLLGAVGARKRVRRWGTVYDSVTKLPLDPVYVTLVDAEGKEIANSITDIDGRFGFLVQPGAYRIWVNKTNYLFPSRKLAGRDHDEVYKDLYFGGEFIVKEGEDAILKNIPMDPELFNWNEYIKHEQKLTKWNAKRDKILNRITGALFAFGFASSVIAAVIRPTTFNLIMIGVYVVLLLIRELGMNVYSSGSVATSRGEPVAYGLVRIYSAKLGKQLFTRALDKYGRYYALVPKGEYYVTIEVKNADESYKQVFTSAPFAARRGVINKKFTIS